jgi:hypothetical protein
MRIRGASAILLFACVLAALSACSRPTYSARPITARVVDPGRFRPLCREPWQQEQEGKERNRAAAGIIGMMLFA